MNQLQQDAQYSLSLAAAHHSMLDRDAYCTSAMQ